MSDNNSLWMVAIVAIVAVVGMITLLSGSATTTATAPQMTADGIPVTGEAYRSMYEDRGYNPGPDPIWGGFGGGSGAQICLLDTSGRCVEQRYVEFGSPQTFYVNGQAYSVSLWMLSGSTQNDMYAAFAVNGVESSAVSRGDTFYGPTCSDWRSCRPAWKFVSHSAFVQ